MVVVGRRERDPGRELRCRGMPHSVMHAHSMPPGGSAREAAGQGSEAHCTAGGAAQSTLPLIPGAGTSTPCSLPAPTYERRRLAGLDQACETGDRGSHKGRPA